MLSKRSQEGYVLIDHRNSPGISPEFIRANNLDAPAVGSGQVFESALSVCHHCQSDVILNPRRDRERGWCWNCDHYICDDCVLLLRSGGKCKPFKSFLEDLYNRLMKGFKF